MKKETPKSWSINVTDGLIIHHSSRGSNEVWDRSNMATIFSGSMRDCKKFCRQILAIDGRLPKGLAGLLK